MILEQSKRANVGHIGSCLCVAEILAALYSGPLAEAVPGVLDRNRFVLAKGHAGLALFSALAIAGRISQADLNTFCGNNTMLGVHPEAALVGVDFSTGSLGQGICYAAGAALAARMQGSRRRVFCLISDGECNEGSVWEAAMFAAHHRLGNLTVILDCNGQQAFGLTRDVLEASNIAARWQVFGWKCEEVDGHSLPELSRALVAGPVPGPPKIVVARTVFGKGVSYMERGVSLTQTHLKPEPVMWHYLPMSDQEYRLALDELERA